MTLDKGNKKRLFLISVFLSIFIVGTILMLIIPISIKVTYGGIVVTSDGESIAFNVFEPAGKESQKKPAIIIAHGFMANKEIMKGYAIELAAAGYVAVPFDFRGHGQSSGILENSKLINDVIAIKDYLSSRGDIEMDSLGYIGYSMGGFPGNQIIKSDTAFKCFIGVGTGLATNASDIRIGNFTNPLNVLMIQAKFDEAVDLSTTKEGIGLRVGIDGSNVDVNQLYGSFEDGNASMIFYDDNTDHLLLAWDQDFIRAARDWVINTFPSIRPIDENFYVNIRGLILIIQCIGGIGFFFLIIEPLSERIVKVKEEERYIIKLERESIKSISIKGIVYTLSLSLVGMLMLIPLFLFLPISITGMMGMFLFGSAMALLIMFWRIGKKADITVKTMLKGVFKRPKGQLKKEVLLGVILAVILYIIVYLSTGLNYFAMIPYFIKVLWTPPYYAIYFLTFIILGIFFHVIIQNKFERDLKSTYKLAFLIFGFQILYFVVYIYLLCILMGSTFFMLTYFIAVPLTLLCSFVTTFLYKKTGNIISGVIVITTLFVGIISALSPFFLGINMLSIFGAH